MAEEKKKKNKTTIWSYYERGRAYNNSLSPNQYSLVNSNIEFFAGNQWINMPETAAMSRLPKPVFNIIKRVTSLFVASLTSSAVTITFEPLAYYDGTNLEDPNSNAATYATAEVRNLFEKFKMDYRIRDALFDGAVTGDYCAHFYWDPNALSYGGAFGPYRGEIKMELVDGVNVMFGNPNVCSVQDQPYILLIGRDTVENLREEAKRHKSEDAELIQPDSDTSYQAGEGGKKELAPDDDGTGKALYAYAYYKVSHEEDVIDPATGAPMMETVTDRAGNPVIDKDSSGRPLISADGVPVYKKRPMRQIVTTVHVSKATKDCTIFEDIDTGLDLYPIAWGNWERQKNQYHGRALVTGIIPNQIFINTMFAMVMRHLQLLGFPKTIYNADIITQWTNDIGQAIGVHGIQPGQGIDTLAYNLQPADMSNQIIATIDKALIYTKDCLGATDVQLGSAKIETASALMVLQSNSEVPMENTRACLHEWVEDIGNILLDMMGTYYGERPIVRERSMQDIAQDSSGTPQFDPFTGQMALNSVTRRVVEPFDFSKLKRLWLNVDASVGSTSRYSEIAMTQTLDNLRRDGMLDIIDYLDRVPDKLIPRKQELLDKLKAQQQLEAEQLARQQSMQMENGIIPGSDGQAIGSTTEEEEAAAGAAQAAKTAAAQPVEPREIHPVQGGPLDDDKALSKLPAGMRDRFDSMPRKAQTAMIKYGQTKQR